MTTLAERINELLIGSDRKAADIARHCKISRATVSAWVNGQTKKIDGATAFKVAQLFGVSAEWVQTGNGTKLAAQKIADTQQSRQEIVQNHGFKLPTSTGIVRILNWNEAKTPMAFVDNSITTGIKTAGAAIAVGVDVSNHTFAVVVIDDAMVPIMSVGEIVIVEPAMEPITGDYVLVRLGDSLLIRQLIDDCGQIMLRPANRTDYTTKPLDDGEVIGVIRGKTFIYR